IGTSDVAAFERAAAVGTTLEGPTLAVECGGSGAPLPKSADAIWLRLRGDVQPGARLSVDAPLATLPLREVTIVDTHSSDPNAPLSLTCTGTGSLLFSEADA